MLMFKRLPASVTRTARALSLNACAGCAPKAAACALWLGAAWLQASAQSAGPTFTLRHMSPETALKAAQATLASCRAQGFQVAVVVVDRAGLPLVLLRDRFAGAHTPDMALNKAWTAASFRRSTGELAADTQAGKAMSGIRELPRIMAAGGGVPIDEAGTLWGAIGVSGAPGGDADERCARAGIQSVSDDLAM